VGLARLLDSLKEQDFAGSMSIVVADNDSNGSARAIVEGATGDAGPAIHYVIANERGHSQALNVAINFALALDPPVDCIAIIDDDETAPPQWLTGLVKAQQEFDAELVNGPVYARFEVTAPPWMVEGRYHEVLDRPRGLIRRILCSGNLLVTRQLAERYAPFFFSPSFGMTGGADTELAIRSEKGGVRTAWAHDANTFEHVPASRTTKSWLLRRAYRTGSTNVMAQALHYKGWLASLKRVALTGMLIVAGAAVWVVGLPYPPLRIRGELLLARGLGKIAGHLGSPYSEYNHIHGG
jgi:glycosyltransferase involved in cell wall biosynthesis